MSAKNNSPNWDDIKTEYLLGGISQQKLADKHGISRSTLQKRLEREGWREQREEIAKKNAKKLADKAAKIQADTLIQLMEMRAQASIDAYKKVVDNIKKHPDGAGSRTVRETVKVKVIKLDDGEEKKVPLKSSYISDLESYARFMYTLDKMFGLDASSVVEKQRVDMQREQAAAEKRAHEEKPENNLVEMLKESLRSVTEDAIPELQPSPEPDGDMVDEG